MTTRHLILAYLIGAFTVATLWALAPTHAPVAKPAVEVKAQTKTEPQCYVSGVVSDVSGVTLKELSCAYRDGRVVNETIG